MSRDQIHWELLATDALSQHARGWDDLNDGAQRSPLLTSRLFELSLEQFGSGAERLAVARRGNATVAMAILESTRLGSWQTFQPAQAPIGAWVQRRDLSTVDLAQTLLRRLPANALVLGVTQQDPDLLARPAEQANRVETQDYIRTARISVAGSFADYWQARGANLRQNLRKQRNKLARENIATRLEIIADPAAIGAAVDDYGRMESAGWKAEGGTAVHPDNAQGRFYRDLLVDAARSGNGAVYRYFFDQKLVACDLAVSRGGTVVILKTTHDESLAKLSPTMLMRETAFQLIFDERRYERIEFYGKLMDWHTKWSDEIRTMYHVNLWRWPWLRSVMKRVRERRSAVT